jgi:ElaB/YqjD/DUF883 family membrane-anchored ribosome-binding protein
MMRVSTKRSTRKGNGHALAHDWLKIKNAFSDTALDVKDKAGTILTHSVDDLKKKSSKVQNKVETYTAKKPIKSLGIALAVGIAVGFLLRR